VHETELAKTLSVYLQLRNDINKTAKKLHVHRNTLIYRLNKIRDLAGVEIDDPEVAWRFQLIFRVLEVSTGRK
jgi:purine catabolism regulator